MARVHTYDHFAWRKLCPDFVVHHEELLKIYKEIERRHRSYGTLSYDRIILDMACDPRTWGKRMQAEHPLKDGAVDLKYWHRTFFRWKAHKRVYRRSSDPCFSDKGQAAGENNRDFISAQKSIDCGDNSILSEDRDSPQKKNSVKLPEKRENISRIGKVRDFKLFGRGCPKVLSPNGATKGETTNHDRRENEADRRIVATLRHR